MSEVEALPFVHSLALSERPGERALFIRICRDLSAHRRPLPAFCAADLKECLALACADEREVYLAALATVEPGGASRDAIQALLDEGRPERLLALARDPHARLRPEHIAALVAHALREGDRGLAEAVLAREPMRLEAAPLFLSATPEQRRALLLAAQRAELGRRAPPAPRLAPALAERLEFAAIAGAPRDFAAALGAALGVDAKLAEAIAADRDGEPLAVALAAIGAPQDLSVRVMTGRDLSEGGHDFQRVHTLSHLGDRLTVAAARRIVAAMAGQGAAQSPAPPAPAPRQTAAPSPFLRRESSNRQPALNRETTTRSAQNSRTP